MTNLIPVPIPPIAAELDFTTYQTRQMREVTPERLTYRAGQLRASGKFVYSEAPPSAGRGGVGVGAWRGSSYEGCAVVSMVSTNPGNDGLSESLQAMQQQVTACFATPASCFLLPPASFHQTIANTLSDDRYRAHVVQPGLTDAYPAMIGRAFAGVSAATDPAPIRMRLVGLSLFSSAVGMLGVFEQPADYERILAFREAFYADPDLAALTVRRTRPFIGHITLAYLETELPKPEKTRLVETCAAINQRLTDEPLYFTISTTELRSYPHLADFQTKPGYPVYSFVA